MLSVVGTRPEFVQAAPLSRALRGRCREVVVHTGQHYDDRLSAAFFADLDLPEPEYQLGVGSGSHGEQTAGVLLGMERVIEEVRPDVVLVRGDTNSSLGAALAAVKLGARLAHAEAGARSFNRRMAEEVNRVLVDAVSDLLFCPTATAVENLASEGITRGVHLTGDITADAVRTFRPAAGSNATLLERLELETGRYALATIHRAENTAEDGRLAAIFEALGRLPEPVLVPLHPRTAAAMRRGEVRQPANVRLSEPVPYLDMLALLGHARVCLTDSGGLQKEAYLVGTPCVTLRDETEWIETVASGWNVLAGADPDRIVSAALCPRRTGDRAPLFGDGHAAERMAELLLS